MKISSSSLCIPDVPPMIKTKPKGTKNKVKPLGTKRYLILKINHRQQIILLQFVK
jgi:hypothetical protein